MTHVQMVAGISGTRNGQDWPAPGCTLDVPAAEAAELIAAGLAVAGPQKAAVTPPREERAVAPRAETRKGQRK